MEHNQAKREAFYKELDSMTVDEIATTKMKNKDCKCEDCLEELRCLMAESYVEMGLPVPKTIKV